MEIFSVTKSCLNSRNPGKLGAVRMRGLDVKIPTAGEHRIGQLDSRI